MRQDDDTRSREAHELPAGMSQTIELFDVSGLHNEHTKVTSFRGPIVLSVTSGIKNTKIFAEISVNQSDQQTLGASSSSCDESYQTKLRNFMDKMLIFEKQLSF